MYLSDGGTDAPMTKTKMSSSTTAKRISKSAYGSVNTAGTQNRNERSLSGENSTIWVPIHPIPTSRLKKWEFPGWGSCSNVNVATDELQDVERKLNQPHKLLGEWPATAICGNDILSSCLYVAGLVASKAGKLAPVAMALVAGILYLYRFIYGEVVNAIPLNGGSYNVLLNTTSKRVASFAASLALLSYIATGVVSGTSACTYLTTLLPTLNVVTSTVILLFFFAALSVIGITESAVVALTIFIGHSVTLVVLCILCISHVFQNPNVLWLNWQSDFPEINMAGTIVDGNVGTALFFGLASAMLGISGFESSSQFVEEQKPGVFPKTLRNMWWSVAIFNPLLSFLSLGVLPLTGAGSILESQNTVLAKMGYVVGGTTLETWICIDAFIVLSGAVLTAYVGVTGLVRRLASDRVLPSFLLRTNSWRNTNHFIIFGYFAVASSLVLILEGDVETLSGVYTYAFLGLMILFTTGCMLLKFKRAEIPRTVVAPWWSCVVGIAMVLTAFLGNLLGDPTILTYFALYFLAVLVIVAVMFQRIFLLRVFLYALQRICPSRGGRTEQDDLVRETKLSLYSSPSRATGARGGRTIARIIMDINQPPILFFCKKLELSTINKAILYVRTNEQTSCLRIVHVSSDSDNDTVDDFAQTVAMFDRIYPKLKIDFLSINGSFGPSMIEWVSTKYQIPKNMMFIKQTDENFAHTIATLGGVRVVTG